jgi:hypothetical protein
MMLCNIHPSLYICKCRAEMWTIYIICQFSSTIKFYSKYSNPCIITLLYHRQNTQWKDKRPQLCHWVKREHYIHRWMEKIFTVKLGFGNQYEWVTNKWTIIQNYTHIYTNKIFHPVFFVSGMILIFWMLAQVCGLVVRVPGYRSRGLRSIPGATRFSEK